MRPFDYAVATDAADAVALMSLSASEVKFLAGGTTLYDLMKLDVERPSAVIDVRRIPGLSVIDTSGPELVFGAGAPMSAVAEDPVVRRDYPALSQSLAKAASQQLRNMATVGGNLLQRTRCTYFRAREPYVCNKRQPGSGCAAREGSDRDLAVLGTSASCVANYPGDWAIALVAFDALIDVLGPDGERTLPVAELHREPGDTPDREHTLAQGELILRIRVPASPLGRASTYHKIRDRESYAFALASAATALDLEGGVVRDVRIAVGGVASRPWRCRDAEDNLRGRVLTDEAAVAAGRRALAGAIGGRENGFKIELGVRTVADALMIAAGRRPA